jgi:2-methylcitrate dehydratase PrpD
MTSFTSSVTAGLARLLLEKPVDKADLEAAALFTLDAIANAVAGLSSPQGAIIRAWAKDRPLDAGRQAFVMGALTHILEVDDLHKASVVHPGCVVVPAAWVMARKTGASGADFLRAVLWGFEATTRVGMAVGPAHYRIWHNTATCGPYGSAAAVGALLSLSEAELVHAFGNAGTQSAGLWEFMETGAMTKHLHAGRGAEAGLVAAELAKLGFTGPAQILEGERGFFAAACPDAAPELVLADPNHVWQVHETSIKPWPSCRHTHPIIDAAQRLRNDSGNRLNRVEVIQCVKIETYQAALNLCDNSNPESEYAAKFSLQHTVAAALIDDEVTFASFDAATRERLSALRDKVSVGLSEALEAAYPTHWGGALEVTLSDGSRLRKERQDALGDPENPLSRDRLIAKASELFRHGGMDRPAQLVEDILGLVDGGALPELPLPV